MSPTEMGESIAAACRWSRDHNPDSDFLYRTADGRGMFNPAACLNAMHEAEKVLTEKSRAERMLSSPNTWDRYQGNLAEIVGARLVEITTFTKPDSAGKRIELVGWHYAHGQIEKLIHASASQKAEAFLRTLNLWHPAPGPVAPAAVVPEKGQR